MRKLFTQTSIAAILIFSIHLYSATLNAQVSVSFAQRGPVLSSPMEVHTAPGDNSRLFIVEKAGTIRIWNGTSLLATPFLNISSIVEDGGEQGLLSMAFHPNYQSNGFFFVYYNDNSGRLTIARYQVSADANVANGTANPVTPLVNISKPFTNHNGGHIQFKPEGGINYLYVATGDGGDANDPQNNSQNLNSKLGKLIRIDADDITSPTMEIMAWGLRNPFRWSFDRLTGDLWIGDVGQGAKEEVDFFPAGPGRANFGWPCREGTRDNEDDADALPDNCDTVDNVYIHPVAEYDNPPCCGTSVIGGYRYRGSAYPQFQGYYMFADYFYGYVWFTRSNGGSGWITTGPQTVSPANISSFSEAYNGDSLFAVSMSTNRFYKIVPNVVTPVSLLTFSGTKSPLFNDLRWTTAFEESIENYIIEYSRDGRNYTEIGTVPSIGSTDVHTYTFRHNIVSNDKLFYRLRITEQSGTFNYSPTISLGSKDKNGVTVFPTLITSGIVNVNAASPVEKIEIMNISGQKIVSKDMNNADGYFQVVLPPVPKGIYYMQIRGKDFHQTEKLIIQ